MKKYESPVIEITEIRHDDTIMAASTLYAGKQESQTSGFASLEIDF